MSLLDILRPRRRPVPDAPSEVDRLAANLRTVVAQRDNFARKIVQLSRQIDEREQEVRDLGKRLNQAENRASVAEALLVERSPLAYEPLRAPAYPAGVHTLIGRQAAALRAMEERLAAAEGRPTAVDA